MIILNKSFWFLCAVIIWTVTTERITFYAVEHPVVTYTHPKFFKYVKMTSRRYSRSDPVHYFSIHFINLQPLGNDLTAHFYFYEFLTNVYKPSFVELHKRLCSLVEKDPIFGAPMKRAFLKIMPNFTCPFPPGDYNMQNCTINPAVLPNFPFTKGRIYGNLSLTKTDELVASGHVDFQIKQMRIKKQN